MTKNKKNKTGNEFETSSMIDFDGASSRYPVENTDDNDQESASNSCFEFDDSQLSQIHSEPRHRGGQRNYPNAQKDNAQKHKDNLKITTKKINNEDIRVEQTPQIKDYLPNWQKQNNYNNNNNIGHKLG